MLMHVLNLDCSLQKTHFVTYFRLTLKINLRTTFISSHFFGKNDAENLALRDQGLCVAAAHLFAEEINTESDWLEKIWPPKVTNFQDLPIYNKLNISSAKVEKKTATH